MSELPLSHLVAPTARGKPPVRLIGTSRAITALEEEIDRVARSDAKVLITGESGVGKEIVARSIHARGPRAQRVLALVNCAGLPETLLESELFGHAKGSFTGAYRDKPGQLESAHLGTVFLDELGEMTLRMQGLLLRFLESGELQKVGAEGAGRVVDVRVVAATNRDLPAMIAEGTFREDLFYRLNVIHLAVPPLRERSEDVPILVDHFLARFAQRDGTDPMTVSSDALAVLTDYRWPGNVRELENLMERLVVTVSGKRIDVDDLSVSMRSQSRVAFRPKPDRRRTVVDELYERMLDEQESFWTSVHPLFMQREVTRANVRDIVRRGLEEAHGNYKIVVRLFNIEGRDYKRFLNFLRKHDCQVPFRDYR